MRSRPVVLARRFDAAGEENYVCVSLVMYPRQWSWGQIRGLLADRGTTPVGMGVAALVPKSAAQGLAFDTWLGQTDHADHLHNIILGLDPIHEADRCFVFLDYAMAMGVKGAWDRAVREHHRAAINSSGAGRSFACPARHRWSRAGVHSPPRSD